MDGLNINFKQSLLFKSGRNWVGRGLLTSTNWCSEWALQTNLVSVHWFTGWFWENPLSIWFLDGINISFFPINWSLECIIYGISPIFLSWRLKISQTLTPADWKIFWTDSEISGPIPSPGMSVQVWAARTDEPKRTALRNNFDILKPVFVRYFEFEFRVFVAEN